MASNKAAASIVLGLRMHMALHYQVSSVASGERIVRYAYRTPAIAASNQHLERRRSCTAEYRLVRVKVIVNHLTALIEDLSSMIHVPLDDRE
jgi:hypothetical protein